MNKMMNTIFSSFWNNGQMLNRKGTINNIDIDGKVVEGNFWLLIWQMMLKT